MVRESGISAMAPIFPSYLLPSLKLPFRRRSSATSDTSIPSLSDGSSPPTSPSTASPSPTTALSRTAPDTLRCRLCSTDVALASQILSRGFTGRHGRAILVAPLPPALRQHHDVPWAPYPCSRLRRLPRPPGGGPAPAVYPPRESEVDAGLLNVRVGRSENRQLATGWHTVADVYCASCGVVLGWKYVDAREEAQRYKIGRFILETERTTRYKSWEDVPGQGWEVAGYGGGGEFGKDGEEDGGFDSADDDECDDLFAGTWDAETALRRRAMRARLDRELD